jgi:hypothetical protein
VGNIRSLLDELCSEDLPGLTDAQLEEDFAELQRAAEIIRGRAAAAPAGAGPSAAVAARWISLDHFLVG